MDYGLECFKYDRRTGCCGSTTETEISNSKFSRPPAAKQAAKINAPPCYHLLTRLSFADSLLRLHVPDSWPSVAL